MHCSVAALFVALRDALSSGHCSGYYSGQYSGYCISLSSYTVEPQLRERRYKYVNFGAFTPQNNRLYTGVTIRVPLMTP